MRSRANFERVEDLAFAVVECGRHLCLRHPQADAVEIEPVELFRVVAQRLVAAGGNVGDDGANSRLDVCGYFALGIQKCAEPLRKIGGACVEADGHVMPCAQCGDAYQFSFIITILIFSHLGLSD